MSVSLVVLRFEIAATYPLLVHLNYIAPKLTKPMDGGTGLKAEACSSPAANMVDEPLMTEAVLPEERDKLIRKHRGCRELHEINIETIRLQEDRSSKPPSGGKPLASAIKSPKSSKESTPDIVVESGATGHQFDRKPPLAQLNQIQFHSGNHCVETTRGILHLYKESKLTPMDEEAERSELVSILAVPTSMTTHDLLQFVAPLNHNIEHIRIIRDNKPNQYMVTIKFRNQKAADEFYRNYHGVPFNSIEPEICNLVFVAKVETINESQAIGPPQNGLVELPTCPVCLERMDESVEGILTILCNHSFHSGCLSKWGDLSCPICRYCQTPEPVAENMCFECGAQQESLWICLICGHIGCGRYVEGHAYTHYCETQHTYAMQLGLNRVWDYAGDNYVHRLLQNKSDGKPVEVECNYQVSDEKIDSVQLEYTYLLTNQLEAQRRYFEESMSRVEALARSQIDEIMEKTKLLTEDCDHMRGKLESVTKEKQVHEKKLTQASNKLTKTLADLGEEREINKCLTQNQMIFQQKLLEMEKKVKEVQEKKDEEVGELKEQLRDLMFYLEAQDKLTQMPEADREEIESGRIVVSPGSSDEQKGRTSRNRSRNKRK